MLDPGNDPPFDRPGLGGIAELAKPPLLVASFGKTSFGVDEPRLGQCGQPRVLGQTDNVADRMPLAPGEQAWPAKAAVAAQDEAHREFPFGMIVEPAGSSFLTAQKTRGRAHRFFACHFLAYAQGGQSISRTSRVPRGALGETRVDVEEQELPGVKLWLPKIVSGLAQMPRSAILALGCLTS